mmetsp:Transcript_21918/g.30125  ORF Transcript_21918/g.30125 Transcript_21918/m.30125 type:complete len:145 (+) Transcript_21918:29-463(+)|eukprot:CAMPEP_0170064302 /NCGR_PEP_ID=MMETSP0019_2-20121128/4839_1 /TAXON_ID=98059 /ORGANISM="Dinobryon sp., Strain UTEXLB2267" /LENGTH=144 /DNA_ID=CAMNT_0010270935 /DNA_START=1 /DNA_END=435 /DNA_ORIENTATION=-
MSNHTNRIFDQLLSEGPAISVVCLTLLGALYYSYEATKESRNYFGKSNENLNERMKKIELALNIETQKSAISSNKIFNLELKHREFKSKVIELENQNDQHRASIRELQSKHEELKKELSHATNSSGGFGGVNNNNFVGENEMTA